MSSKFASPFMAKSPLRQDEEEKKVKISRGGTNKYNDRSVEYIKGGRTPDERGRSVEISQGTIDNTKPAGEDNEYNTKTVRRRKKDGTVKTKSKKISNKKAERIKKRKDKKYKEISE